MNAADRLKEFIEGINNYIFCKNLAPSNFNPDFARADNLSTSEMNNLTRDDCFTHAYMLYQYADHVASERAACDTVVRWCENSLNSIIASEITDMAGEYLKHDIKVATIVREHELANKINDWKITAEARLEPLRSREYNIRRKADILIEKGKRK